MFSKRCIHFINCAINVVNVVLKTITRMGVTSRRSIIGANTRHLQVRFNMPARNVIQILDYNDDEFVTRIRYHEAASQ